MTMPAETMPAPAEQPWWSRATDFLRGELAPYPGRLEDALRIAALAVLTVIISETLQIPLVAYSAYIVFFTSKEDAASTLAMGIVCTIAASCAVLLAEAVYAISAGEPAVRMPLMLLAMFAGMFLWRASPLGMIAFPTSFVLVMALTLVDFIGPTDRLTAVENLSQLVLWLWSVAMLPISLTVLGNILTGRTPARLIRKELAARLSAAGRILAEGADLPPREAARLVSLIRKGPARSMASLKMIGAFGRRSAREKETWRQSIALVEGQASLAIEWLALEVGDPALTAAARALGEYLSSLARAIDNGTALPPVPERPPVEGAAQTSADARKGYLLLDRIAAISDNLRAVQSARPDSAPDAAAPGPRHRRRLELFVADAFTNPAYCRYALKSTLAIFITYLCMTAVTWPGIRTCVITAFFVALGSSGETTHKMALRMTGALIGCGLGLGTVVYLMPHMTTIAQLSLLIGVVSFLAAWVALSSERLSYAGLQIAMAFFFSTLVGFAPSIDHIEARDRVVGILFGIIIVYVVFTCLWPVSALTEVRNRLAAALEKLSKLLSIAGGERAGGEMDELLVGVQVDLAQARRVTYLEHFESGQARRSGPVKVGTALVDSVQGLLGPAVILASASSPAGAPTTGDHARSLAGWLARAAAYLRSPTAAPAPQQSDDAVRRLQSSDADVRASAYADWCRTMDDRAREIDAGLRDAS